MVSPLVRKLENFAPLPNADRALIETLSKGPASLGARTTIIAEGKNANHVNLIVEGFACRYGSISKGRRQLTAFLLPGDICDLHVLLLKEMDHSISTISTCKIVRISRTQIASLFERPAIAKALWWADLVDQATLRAWVVNIGARPGFARIAHLICEVFVRLDRIGLVNEGTFEFPLTQIEFAEAAGVSPVHLNRILQRLRAADLSNLGTRLSLSPMSQGLRRWQISNLTIFT